MLWHIEVKFCTWLCFDVLQIKFVYRLFASVFKEVIPLMELWIKEMQFSAVFFRMLWHIVVKFCTWLCYDVIQISSSVVTLRQFLKELCLFLNLEYRKCAIFHTFLLHALTYWAAILHDFVLMYNRSSSSIVTLLPLALRPSIHFLHLPSICIDNWA